MKRCFPLMLLLLGHVAVGVSAQSKTGKPSTAAAVGVAVKELAADLKEARELVKKVTDRTTRDRLELLITRSELKALEIERAISGLPGASPAAPSLTAEAFAELLKGIKKEAFDEGKADFVATFATKGRLNCAQARDLLKTFAFDEGRTRAAIALYPCLTDPQQFFTVLEVFTFEAGRKAVRDKLKLDAR